MIRNLGFILAFLFYALVVNSQTAFVLLFTYIVGTIIVSRFTKNESYPIQLYQLMFIVASMYTLISYLYMGYHNYEYLLAYDTFNYFIPHTKSYLANGGLLKSLHEVWHEYTLLDRNMPGYFSLLVVFGKLSEWFGSNFYITLQLSTIIFSSMISVVLYKIFIINKFNEKTSFKYALLISLFSVLFFYSTSILRDSHIALLYLCAMYLTFKSYNIKYVLIIIALCIITMTFRVESGLFLFSLVPTYLLLSLKQKNYKIIIFITSLIIISAISYFYFSRFDAISTLFIDNREVYVETVTERSSGVIGTLQKIPIAGDIGSIIYNAIQPFPFWSKLSVGLDNFRPEMYNIMTFPLSFAAFFNWMVIFIIFHFIFSSKLRTRTTNKISKPLKYNLIIGLLFLFMQSAVISQRRLMAFYCIYYVLFFIIYNSMNLKLKKNYIALVVTSFFTINIFLFLFYFL